MWLKDGSRAALRAVPTTRVLGFVIYVAAFLLPACREPSGSALRNQDVYLGWFCAAVTVMNTFSRDVWTSKDSLSVLSGWINPLILIYLVLLIRPRFVWPRRIVAGAMVVFMLATWIYFALAPLIPLIGHFMWIVGALMVLAGEVVGHGASPTSEDAHGSRQLRAGS
jgi:hypothetical protein